MVNKIEILIKNGTTQDKCIAIIPNKNICYVNNKEYYIKSQYINSILDILVTWKYEYGNNKNIDSEEFLIKVTGDKKNETVYHGNGNYPNNYFELLEILREVVYGRKNK